MDMKQSWSNWFNLLLKYIMGEKEDLREEIRGEIKTYKLNDLRMLEKGFNKAIYAY